MKRSVALAVGGMCLWVAVALSTQESKEEKSKPDLTQQYFLLATRKTSTMQKELSEAGAAGYRIMVGSPTSGVETALILEKVAAPPNTYEYFLLATTKTSTKQKELNEAAAQGFRLLPRTMIAKEQMLGPVEIVVVMEKAPRSEKRYQYLLLATSRTATLQKEMAQALAEGYEVVGMVSRGEHMAILEKEVRQ